MKRSGNWRDVADAARTTIGMDAGTKEPTDRWKKSILLAEHSPIRLITFNHTLQGIKSWVATHLTRHKFGVDHFVSTRRSDRTGIDRGCLSQDEPVNHRILANTQAVINISRKRLCRQASVETQQAWKSYLKEIEKVDPIIASVCVPECVYRGFCPEMKPCGWSETDQYKERLEEYRKL